MHSNWISKMHLAFVQEKSFLDIQIFMDLSVILNLLYYNFDTPNKVSPMNSRDFFLLKVKFLIWKDQYPESYSWCLRLHLMQLLFQTWQMSILSFLVLGPLNDDQFTTSRGAYLKASGNEGMYTNHWVIQPNWSVHKRTNIGLTLSAPKRRPWHGITKAPN